MKGKLTLVPTPIDSESKLNPEAFELLLAASQNPQKHMFLVEDPKPARRRWIHFGLPREIINEFVYFNEQTSKALIDEIIGELKSGKNVFLMSDAGLPAFCDPGADLIDRCHDQKIIVTATPFFNSVTLALAMSGFSHRQFMFHGFVPRKTDEREEFLKSVIKNKNTGVLMDTPYRLKNLLESLQLIENTDKIKREYFLAMELGKSNETYLRGKVSMLRNALEDHEKPEFILVINAICP